MKEKLAAISFKVIYMY